jgi:chromosome partitioning protein
MIYGLTNSKGGVGKTTIAVHLAHALSENKKRKVIFIDADTQLSSSKWIKDTGMPVRLEQLHDPDSIIKALIRLSPLADDIVIDGPAGLSQVTRAIMLRADRVFLPCGPSSLDLRAASLAVQVLKEAQKARKGPPWAALIPNKLQKRGRLSTDMLTNAVGRLQIPVLSGLSMRQSFADAAGQGQVVSKMGFSARPAAREMNTLLKEMTHG